MNKLQFFDLPSLYAALDSRENHYYLPWNLSNTGTCYLVFNALMNIQRRDLVNVLVINNASLPITQQQCSKFVEEPWDVEVYNRIKQIEENAKAGMYDE